MQTAMIVHESWIMREIMKGELAACDCQVACYASSRLEASLAYRLYRPDIVLVNAMFNGGNGYRVIDDVLDIDSSAIVVAMVSLNEDTTALRALVSGAYGFLVIPSTPEAFRFEIERALLDKFRSRSVKRTPEYDLKHPFHFVLCLLSAWRETRRNITKQL